MTWLQKDGHKKKPERSTLQVSVPQKTWKNFTEKVGNEVHRLELLQQRMNPTKSGKRLSRLLGGG